MKREIITTADGSTTIHIPEWNEQYHSKHGAIQEAYHVFIKHGLQHVLSTYEGKHEATTVSKNTSAPNDLNMAKKPQCLSILEIGFGTGLNAFITLLEAEKFKTPINYYGVEGYPVLIDEIHQLNYSEVLHNSNKASVFNQLHQVSWEEHHKVTPYFSLTKQNRFFADIKEKEHYNLIYFDAFGARVQPELWTEDIFKSMFNALLPHGVLVTYAAKGIVRRAMETVGFKVERLPGPPGKREMLRACKLE